ncbi:hypothetical protein E4U43_003193 [Claviceps pusilla]|uniref:Tat pathway signal sequence n=1 Tax=Claviceps pusilla TaxID=123648 RepID=A0A9P7SXW4_9HYPO|nr:hypothetical protein E4U43_003193 [Claviceps pusilla]
MPCQPAGFGIVMEQNGLRESDDDLRDIATQLNRFDGSLFPSRYNKYRGPPSRQLDEAWDRFTTNPWMIETAVVLNVSRHEVHRSGNNARLDTAVELDGENGGGYMATIEMFHQLHCLNLLRKWTFADYYQSIDPLWTMPNAHRREHTGALPDLFYWEVLETDAQRWMCYLLDHCIDMIRQALMCNGDTGLITFHWVRGISVPTPDFHTMHQCADPESVLQWAKDRAAPIVHEIRKTGGETELDGL